jgi:hypothetical protein
MRKLLFAGAAALPLLLVGCSSTSSVSTQVHVISAQAASDIQTLAAGLPAVLTVLQTAGVSATTLAAVQQDVTLAQQAAAQIAAGGTSALGQFEGGVNAILSVASSIAPTNPIIVAAGVLVPVIEGVATIATAAAPMSPDQARMILRQAAR